MPSGPRRPRFYLAILVTGFLFGGFLQAFLSRILPESPARAFFTTAARGEFGPVTLKLLVLDLTLGPVGVEISLLSVLGVLVAYLVARSLF